MEYILQYKKEMQWVDWGFKTLNKLEIEQKIDYAKRALGSSCPKLRYRTKIKNSYIPEHKGIFQLF